MKKESLTKAVGIFTIITTIITLGSAIFNFWGSKYLSYKLNADISKADSIGIIGGADGPTAIYVTGKSSSNLIIVIFALLSITGIAYQIFAKKATK